MKNLSEKSGLSRKLGLFTAIMVVICSMIGSGVFKKIAPMAATLYSPSLVMLCWFVAGSVTLFGALSFSGLSKINNEAGGQYQYLKIIFGKFFSFLYGWTAFAVIQSASIASIAYIFGQSFGNLVNLPHLSPEWSQINLFGYIFPFDNIGVKLVTIITIVIITLINYFGVEYGGFTVNFFTIAKMLGILILILFGLSFSQGSMENVSQVSQNYNTLAHQDLWQIISVFFAAMISAFWAFDGWANITFLAGEVHNPKKNLPIAIIGGVLAVTAIYLLINFTYLYVMPVDSYIAISKNPNSIAATELAKYVIGPAGFVVVSLLIMISTFGTTNSSIMSSSRIYFAMAKEGMFFKSMATTHKKHKTPHVSLAVQCVWACVLVISGTFDQLTDMLIFAAFIFYGAGALGLFVLKIKGLYPEKVFGYPVFPALFIIFCVFIIISSFIQRPLESFTGVGLVLIGVPVYFYMKKKKI
ncbi:MAG: amino acid permease [Bacteroidetes bacterium]|nr:amino acid permease [Bacteroidota bacterium]